MSIFKGTFFYTAGMLIPQVIGFLLLPLYSRLLTKADFSIVSLLEALTLILSFVAVFAADRAVLRYLSNPTVCNQEAYSFFYASAIVLPTTVTAVAVAIFYFLPDASIFTVDLLYILIAILIGSLRAGIQVFTRLIQFNDHYYQFLVLSAFRGGLDLVFISILLVYFFGDFRGAIYGMLATTIIIYISAAIVSRPLLYSKPSKVLVKDIIYFCLPIIPTIIIAWVMGMSGRFFLEHFSNMKAVADFSMAYKISYLLAIIAVAIQTSISKRVYGLLEQGAINVVNRYFQLIILGFVLFTIVYSLAIFCLESIILGEQYVGIWRYCLILNFAMCISGIVGISSNLIFYHFKKNVLHLVIYTVMSIIFVILYIQLIPIYDVAGAALSLLCGNLVLATVHFYYSFHLGGITKKTIFHVFSLSIFLMSACYVFV